MLKIITSKNQKPHNASIESFLDLLKVYQNVDLSNIRKKRATFIIAEDSQQGVYGGAVLYSQSTCSSSEDKENDRYEDALKSAFADFRPEIQDFWMARICFCSGHDLSQLRLEGVKIFETFYRDLYKAFIEVGKQEDIEFLAFTLAAFDPFNLRLHQKWPNGIKVSHSAPFDRYYHGILPFKGTKFFPTKKRKPILGSSAVNQNKNEAAHLGRVH